MGKKAKGVDEPVDAPAQWTHTVIRYRDGSYRWGSHDIEAETQAEGFEGFVAQGLTDEQAFTLVEELNHLKSQIKPGPLYVIDDTDWLVVLDEERGPVVVSSSVDVEETPVVASFSDKVNAVLFASFMRLDEYEGAYRNAHMTLEVL